NQLPAAETPGCSADADTAARQRPATAPRSRGGESPPGSDQTGRRSASARSGSRYPPAGYARPLPGAGPPTDPGSVPPHGGAQRPPPDAHSASLLLTAGASGRDPPGYPAPG